MTNEHAGAFSLKPEFGPVDVAEWRARVDADLGGAPFEKRLVTATYEGIAVQPLYTAESTADLPPIGQPGAAPLTRGATPLGSAVAGWDIRQLCRHGDPATANAAILDDLRRGARSVLLELDTELCGVEGVRIETLANLSRALRGVDMTAAPVVLAPSADALPAAAALLAHCEAEGFEPSAVQAHLGLDPLGALACSGRLHTSVPTALAQLADAALHCAERWPGVVPVLIDTAPYHAAGSSSVQDLAWVLATGVTYLRALEQAGLEPERASRLLGFRLRLGTRFFMTIAKLRAARRLWYRVLQASGVARPSMRLEVRTAFRVLTRRDPWVNLLRNTVTCFAGALGGADAIVLEPLDAALGPPSELTRRLARNTQIVLQEESSLNRVVDPAGGAWMIEAWTAELAERGWALFQEVERQGGMAALLQSGAVAEAVAETWAQRTRRIATRRDPITGVSEFPLLDERPPTGVTLGEGEPSPEPRTAGEAVELASDAPFLSGNPALLAAVRDEDERLSAGEPPTGALLTALVQAAHKVPLAELRALLAELVAGAHLAPLPRHRYAEPFEALRDRSDAVLAATGARPAVFLANLGPVAEHNARSTFVRNLLEAGGLRALGNDGFETVEEVRAAFMESGAKLAALCSSDARYARDAEAVAGTLREAGARAVVLAGRPGEREVAYRAAGVTHFMFLGGDVLALLEALWTAVEEVTR